MKGGVNMKSDDNVYVSATAGADGWVSSLTTPNEENN